MPERATAALTTRARGDDDHDVVAEAGERLLGGHDAGRDRREQRQQRHQVVAEPAPDEERHHPADDGEGEPLLQRHASSRPGR